MKVLFVCSEPYAGMLPFGSTIVNAMDGFETFAIFVSNQSSDYQKAIANAEEKKYYFISQPKNRLLRLVYFLFPFHILRALSYFYKNYDIEFTHLLTEDSSLAILSKYIKMNSKLIYTVHDAKPHEAQYKNFLKAIYRFLMVKLRVDYITKEADALITCSKSQFEQLSQIFNRKSVYYHNFPSLITKQIEAGNDKIIELNGINNYILFFGRIEKYKGIDLLYQTYLETPALHKWPLVIAGSGFVYFEREVGLENNVYIINRYFNESELKALYTNSYCVVYPYYSATQSGVLSLAFYFNTPAIASDIPFFKEIINDKYNNGFTFKVNDKKSLIDAILSAQNSCEVKENGFKFYKDFYNDDSLRSSLYKIYSKILNQTHDLH